MFWVYSNGRRYLYETRREGGRVRKKYLGTGPLAEELMARAQEIRATLTTVAKVNAAEDDAWAEAERVSDEMAVELDLLVRSALVGAGFHQHSRGEWRKRRGETSTASEADG
jgi:hypothetical protein